MTSFQDAPDEWMEDDEAMEERSVQLFVQLHRYLFQLKHVVIFLENKNGHWTW